VERGGSAARGVHAASTDHRKLKTRLSFWVRWVGPLLRPDLMTMPLGLRALLVASIDLTITSS
jgi:hypothetical protein